MPPLYTLAGILVSLGGLGLVVGLRRRRAEQRRSLQATEGGERGPLPDIEVPPAPAARLQAAETMPPPVAAAVPPPAPVPELPASMPNLLTPRQGPPLTSSWRDDFTHRFPPIARPPAPPPIQPAPTPVLVVMGVPVPTPPLTQPMRYVPPPMPEPQKLTMNDLRRGARAAAKLPSRGATSKVPPRSALPVPERPAPISVRATPQPRQASARTGHPLRGAKYLLLYADAFGEVTERQIRLERVTEDNECVRLHAHCYLRRERREFRTDRIVRITDLATGKAIGMPEAYFSGSQ